MEVLEILQTAITDAELSLYDEDGTYASIEMYASVANFQLLQGNTHLNRL